MNKTFLIENYKPLSNRIKDDVVQQSPRTYVEPGTSIAQTAKETKFWAEG